MSKNKIEAIRCDKCGNMFISGNTKDGLPNGLGFEMQDGRVITLCQKCIMQLGEIKEKDDADRFKKFWSVLGVEV